MVEGRRVSAQRNLGVAQTEGDVIYFLDDDSEVEADTVDRGLRALSDPDVAAVGGPAVTRRDADFWEDCFGEVTASRLGMLHLRSRDRPVGRFRRIDGQELTLCNLMVRRAWFERVQGLNEELYPGEDVHLLQRLNSAGAAIIYDPDMRIRRPRRRTLLAFCRQHFRYGQARGLSLREGRSLKSLPFLVPSVFLVYSLLWLWSQVGGGPLVFYLLLSVAAGARIAHRRGSILKGMASVPLFCCLHHSFGFGVLAGCGGWGPPRGVGEIRIRERVLVS